MILALFGVLVMGIGIVLGRNVYQEAGTVFDILICGQVVLVGAMFVAGGSAQYAADRIRKEQRRIAALQMGIDEAELMRRMGTIASRTFEIQWQPGQGKAPKNRSSQQRPPGEPPATPPPAA